MRLDLESYREKRHQLFVDLRMTNTLLGPLNALKGKSFGKEEEKWRKMRQRTAKHRLHILMGYAQTRERYYGEIRRELMSKQYAFLKPVFEAFTLAEQQIYLVGGTVRDYGLGLPLSPEQDYDFTSNASEVTIKALLSSIGAKVYLSKQGTVHAILDGKKVQVSTFKGPTLDEDLKLRDFTVNAIALNSEFKFPTELSQANYRQLTGRKPLKAAGDPDRNFSDDPLRILRMYRFSQKLGVQIDEATRQAARNHACSLREVKGERLAAELTHILKGKQVHYYLRQMMADGVLQQIMPELSPQVGWDQENSAYPLPLWEHTLVAVKAAEELKGSWRTIFAALLHSVGKPYSFSYHHTCPKCRRSQFGSNRNPEINCGRDCEFFVTKDQGWEYQGKSFDGYATESIAKTQTILKRFRFSEEDSSFIVTLVAGHDVFGRVKDWPETDVRRFVSKVGNLYKPMINLIKAVKVPNAAGFNSTEAIIKLRQSIDTIKDLEGLIAGKVPVTGTEVSEATGLSGKGLGPVMTMLKQGSIDGFIKTKEQAIKFAKLQVNKNI